MATNGKSNIEVTADTRKARKTMGDFFRDIERSGRSFGQVLNSLDPFNSLQNEANQTSTNLNQLLNAANQLDSGLNNLGGSNNLNGFNNDLNTAENNLDDLQDATTDVDHAINNATEEVENFGDASVRETAAAEGSFGKLGETAKKIGGVLIAAFAVDKIKDFATDLAATAGSAQAVKAQFSTVFGDMEGEAAERLGAISGEATILENRMKESFTKIAAFAKTGGMDTADSLNLADRSMRAIADSAAFYDKSLEDTTESLQSFLKGNFENDAALGLSATETTRNAAANDLYGKSFKELSESQKQLALLQMVEDANKVSGALGQAARESDGWENVTGNMAQAWTDFKAKVGGPVLQVAVKGLQGMTKAIQSIDTEKIANGIGGAFSFVGEKINWAKDKLEPLKNAFGALRDVMSGEDETAQNIFSAWGIGGPLWDGLIDKVETARTLIGALRDVFSGEGETAENIFMAWGFGSDAWLEVAGTIDTIRTAFGALKDILSGEDETAQNIFMAWGLGSDTWLEIAGHIETVRTLFGALKDIMSGENETAQNIFMAWGLGSDTWLQIAGGIDSIKSGFASFKKNAFPILVEFGGKVRDFLVDIWPSVQSAISVIVDFVVSNLSKIIGFWKENGAQFLAAVSNVFKGIAAVVMFLMPAILAIIRSIWRNIQGVITGALDIIMGVVKIFSGLFTGDFKKMWEGLKQVFFGAVTFLWNFVQLTFFGKILGGAKAFVLTFRTFFVNLWAGIVQLFKGNATNALNIIKGAWSAISASTRATFNSIWAFFRDIFLFIKNTIVGAATGYVRFLTASWTSIFNTTRSIFSNIWNFFKSIFTRIRDFISGSASGIFNKIRDTWSSLKNNTTGAFRDIYNGIKTKFTDIVNLAQGLPKRIGDGIGAMASKVTSGVTKVINKLASTLGKGVNGVIGGINSVLSKIGVDEKNHIDKWAVPQYAHGTQKGKHPGGLAIVGDGTGSNAGPEIIEEPGKEPYLSPGTSTLVNLAKGAKVWSAKVTKEILAKVPKYKFGDKIRKAKDWAVDQATHIWEGGKKLGKKVVNTAFDVFDYIKNPSKLLDAALSALGIEKPGGTGFTADMAKGAWNKVKSGAVGFVKGKLANFADQRGQGFGSPFRKTSSFGMRRHPITGKLDPHRGDDYGAPAGTPIPAQAAGQVVQAAYHALRGNYVRIKSGIMERIYQHNARNLVGVGETVRKGQAVGTVGSTGASTGPHLHYEVLKNGRAINPAGFFKGGIVKMKQLAWIAEKGMEAIIPLETNRAEGLDLWRKVGEHFGFNMDALMNPDAFNVNFAGNGMEQMQSMSTAGSKLTKAFQPAAAGNSQTKQPVIIQTVLPNGRIMAEEYIDDFNAEDQRRRKMKRPNKGGRLG